MENVTASEAAKKDYVVCNTGKGFVSLLPALVDWVQLQDE